MSEAQHPETSTKTAIVVISDPRSGHDESLARLFNALASAYEFHAAGDKVTIVFTGTGTRWIGEVRQTEHPAHELFEKVQHLVAGASCACAEVFGATSAIEESGYALIEDHIVPGTGGLPSLRNLMRDGYQVLVF